jgi:hypothetical protein
MKIKVNHGDQLAVFEVYDEDVQKLAVETCPILLNLVCSSTVSKFLCICYLLMCLFFFLG